MLDIDNLRYERIDEPFMKLMSGIKIEINQVFNYKKNWLNYDGVYFEQNTKEKILWIYMDRVCKFLNDEPTLINWNTSHQIIEKLMAKYYDIKGYKIITVGSIYV